MPLIVRSELHNLNSFLSLLYLNLNNTELLDEKNDSVSILTNNNLRQIIKPSSQELTNHKKYLKSYLPKNFYS